MVAVCLCRKPSEAIAYFRSLLIQPPANLPSAIRSLLVREYAYTLLHHITPVDYVPVADQQVARYGVYCITDSCLFMFCVL